MLIVNAASPPSEKTLVPTTALWDTHAGTPALYAHRAERAPRSAPDGAVAHRTAEYQRSATRRPALRELIRGEQEAT
jgi:hypothetical protein